MDQFDLVKTVYCLCQRVALAVSTATDKALDTGLGQPFAIADAHVLRSPIRAMSQRTVTVKLAGVQRLLQRIEHEVFRHGLAYAPVNDESRVDFDDKDHVRPALLNRGIGEDRDPDLVRLIRPDLSCRSSASSETVVRIRLVHRTPYRS